MGYYCTVPQCTSLAGKTKNVKFHRFPRDETMADKWNLILKRGKPYTKYSKVCSLHFTQADYNVTTMGQWKTLSKDAVPTQNLPKLNPDGTVMVIRKSRTIKIKKEDLSDKIEKWPPIVQQTQLSNINQELSTPETMDASFAYRLQALNAIANNVTPQIQNIHNSRPKKQDAIMQTDPVSEEEESLMNTSYETDKSYSSDYYKAQDFEEIKFETSKDYTKNDFMHTESEYKDKYVDRKNVYDKIDYQKGLEFEKIPDIYQSFNEKDFNKQDYAYEGFVSSADTLRNQQHNLQMLQEQHRINENQNFFIENQIKQEIEFNNDDEKYLYERNKEQVVSESNNIYDGQRVEQQRMLETEHQVKQEPDGSGCEGVIQPQSSPYYSTGASDDTNGGCYQVARPGPELLIAKQNALAAQTQLWQNTMKRPFFYSESPRYSAPVIHRYEDMSRVLQ